MLTLYAILGFWGVGDMGVTPSEVDAIVLCFRPAISHTHTQREKRPDHVSV